MTISTGKSKASRQRRRVEPRAVVVDAKKTTKASESDIREAISSDRVLGARLASIKPKVLEWRRLALKTAFGLGDLWKKLLEAPEGIADRRQTKLPRQHLITFLAAECRIPRREVVRHIRMAETFTQEDKELLIQHGVDLRVALDLAARKPDVRAVAIKMITEEHCLDVQDLKALCRDMKLGTAARTGSLDISRQAALLKAASARRRADVAAWLAELKTFGEAFMAFADSEPEYRPYAEIMPELGVLAEQAADLQRRLAQIAGEDFLSQTALPIHRSNGHQRTGWQILDRALGQIARRDVCMDGCDWPHGRDSLHIDYELVWELAWVFGYTKDDQPSQLRRQMRIEGRAPLDIDPTDEILGPKAPREFTVLEICAGAGSQAFGLEAAGFRHAGLIEIDPDAAATLRVNRPDWPVIEGDLRQLDLSRFKGVDMLAGGVPCQFFSSLGKRKGRFDDRDLFGEVIRLVKLLSPKAVMLENVPGLGHSNNLLYRLKLQSQLSSLGYDAEWQTLDGVAFGLPQKRRRYVLVGFQPGIKHRFGWPLRIGIEAPTVGEALRDLMGANGWAHVDAWVQTANDQCPTILGASELKSGIDLAAAAGRETWKALGVNPSYFAHAAPDRNAPPPSEEFRPQLTLEMIARLQGLPDGWQLQGSSIQRFRQIANAFPQRMAHALGLSIMRAFTGAAIDLGQALVSPPPYRGRHQFNQLNKIAHHGGDHAADMG